jgi:hypothetical protein
MEDQLRAVVYVAAGADLPVRVAKCGAYCERRGYAVAATLIEDDTGNHWGEIMRMLPCVCPGHDRGEHSQADTVDLIVVYNPAELPRGRLPRWEAVSEEATRFTGPPRRPRRLT